MSGRLVLFRFFVLIGFVLFVVGFSSLNQKDNPRKTFRHKAFSVSSEKHPPYDRYGVLGIPVAKNNLEPKILYNIGYVTGFSESERIPLWCAYRLGETAFLEDYKRYSNWHSDLRVKNCPDPQDYNYKISKKHRGHLAPSFAIARSYGTIAMIESFSMTNACPMSARLNTGIWAKLEDQIFGVKNSWANFEKEVWVLSGPIIGDQRLDIGNSITLPKEYFKILLRDANNKHFDKETFEVLAFRFPEEGAEKESKLREFLCSIDSIEKDTGLDFFSELEDEQEALIESKIADDVWK